MDVKALTELIIGPAVYNEIFTCRGPSAESKGFVFHAIVRQFADNLVCILNENDGGRSSTHSGPKDLSSWARLLPDQNIVLFDPAHQVAREETFGYVGVGKNYLPSVIGSLKLFAEKVGVAESRVVVYGYSGGGFASLMAAAALDGGLAIAEDPLLDITAERDVDPVPARDESAVWQECVEAYAKSFPARARVAERFRSNRRVPSYRLLTNRASPYYPDHVRFMAEFDPCQHDYSSFGEESLYFIRPPGSIVSDGTAAGVHHIRQALRGGWGSFGVSLRKPYEGFDFRKLVALASEELSKIKYIRTDDDRAQYDKTRELLYHAASVNTASDWPYLRLCQAVTKWELVQNKEVLEAALAAYRRSQTADSFVYACRGFISNCDTDTAMARIDELMRTTHSEQIANMGNVFKAILVYSKDDFTAYERLITAFRESKAADFNPYIAVPVSTVFMGSTVGSQYVDEDGPRLLNKAIKAAEMSPAREKYFVSASCDEKYFMLYAEYLVKSFTRSCSEEAILHLTLLDGDIDEVNRMLREWGAKNVHVSIQNLDAGANLGPVSSLVRFVNVFPILHKYRLPVLVIDLDTVITKSMLGLVDRFDGVADICSRVLGGTTAPWEKYTGGFALFYPTAAGIDVARRVAFVSNQLCDDTEPQWWIDQNCFEAGIRAVKMKGDPLRIEDVMALRDDYCVMPVGPSESKQHFLRNALSSVSTVQ